MSKEYNKLDFRIGMVDGKVDYDETLKLSKMNAQQFVELFSGECKCDCRAKLALGYPNTSIKCVDVLCNGDTCPMLNATGTWGRNSAVIFKEWLERAKADIVKDSKPTEPLTPSYNVGDKVWYVDLGGMITEDVVNSIHIEKGGVFYTTKDVLGVNIATLYSNKADALAGIMNINKVNTEFKLVFEE